LTGKGIKKDKYGLRPQIGHSAIVAEEGGLGNAYWKLHQKDKAIGYYEQALTIQWEIGDPIAEGTWLGSLGIAYSQLGQVEKAIEHYKQALVISKEIGDRRNEGTCSRLRIRNPDG
jgi:tetratricopeptide (TPR) repeat protein